MEAFAGNTQLQDAVIRRVEIIGEAARRVSAATRALYPALPWRQMIGMRNHRPPDLVRFCHDTNS